MIIIRCCVKTSADQTEEELIKEVTVSDFCPWSDPKKLEELLKELLFLVKTSNNVEEETEIVAPVSFGATDTSSVVTAAKRLGVTTQQYCSSRQKFLRSYNFTRKESLRTRTVKWLKNKVYRRLVHC